MEIKIPIRFQEDLTAYALNIAYPIEHGEPATFEEACESKDRDSWLAAMKDEICSLMKNNTCRLVDKPPGQKVIGCRWIFKKKLEIPGVEFARFKARVVSKGFSQTEGIDYHDIFSLVVKHSSIRIMLSYVAMYNLDLEQLDIKIVFLHSSLEEVIYM